MLQSMGMQPFAFAHVILPIGISFYTFESISYITDVYRGDVEATEHPVDFATFIALFQHLIDGPVFRYKDLAGQFEKREHSATLFGQGAVRFIQGFIKEAIIAASIEPRVGHLFSLQHPPTHPARRGAAAT